MDKILYVSYLTDDNTFEQVFKAGLEPSVARHRFESAFMKTLLRSTEYINDNVEFISCVPYNDKITERPSYGNFCGSKIRYIWWKKNIFSFVKGILSVYRHVNEWYKRTKEDSRVILTYATNPIMMPLLFRRRTKVITICSEVPRFRVMSSGILSRIKKEYYHLLNEHMDGYIFFSEFMGEVCNLKKKPAIVIEGMPSISEDSQLCEYDNIRSEQIFYAGGLNAENGIVELLYAFVKLKRDDVLLTLCGNGNVVHVVEEFAEKYSNVKYLGSLPNAEILKIEKEATILINPRKVDELLTRYSFPSKTFEYFCSGTVCMMSRLDGIPKEYYQYCYECDSSSAETLVKDLKKVLSIPQSERNEKAKAAYQFILREKTAEKQTEKIIKFLNSMSEEHKG